VLSVGSLFTGIGGFDLGLERAGMRVVWQCESDEFCRAVLRKHWPAIPCYGDVRELSRPEPIDVLCGGFPCKQISRARAREHRLGLAGADSGLWGAMFRLGRELRPRYVLVENTYDLLDGPLGGVLADLAQVGFDAEWDVLPASAFGAPHVRERVFIVAYPCGEGLQGLHEADGRIHLQRSPRALWGGWPPEPDVDRVADGLTARLEPARQRNARLQALGNALVPQIAEWIGRRIIDYERERMREAA
jgi:DNA (cytosine-5)-methyltransferase 1